MISVTDDVTINLWSLRQQPASVAHRMQLKEEKYAHVHALIHIQQMHTCTLGYTCTTHTHTYIHIHKHAHIHTHTHTRTQTYSHINRTYVHYSKILCCVHLEWPSVHTRMDPNGCMLVLIRVMYVLYVWRVWLCQPIPFPGTKWLNRKNMCVVIYVYICS